MFENVLQLREKALFIDELIFLKVDQVVFQFFSQPRDPFQDAKSKVPADHGCKLHGPFEVILQPVHPGGDDPLDGVGDLNVRELPAQNILIVFPLNGAVFQ